MYQKQRFVTCNPFEQKKQITTKIQKQQVWKRSSVVTEKSHVVTEKLCYYSITMWTTMSHIVESCTEETEWRLISATLCRWRRCFVADQLWFMTCIREEEECGHYSPQFPCCHWEILLSLYHNVDVPVHSSRVVTKKLCYHSITMWTFQSTVQRCYWEIVLSLDHNVDVPVHSSRVVTEKLLSL